MLNQLQVIFFPRVKLHHSLSLLAMAACALTASAGPVALTDFDIIVKDNLTLNGVHVHGSTLVGGNVVLNGNMSEFGNHFSGPGAALVVDGSITFGADARVNGTKIANLGSATGTITSQGLNSGGRWLYAATVNVGPVGYDVDASFANFSLLSQAMAQFESTVSLASVTSGDAQNKQLNLNFAPGSGSSVLNLTYQEFKSFKNIQVANAAANTRDWVINVDMTGYDGATITQNRNGDSGADQVLWNFFGADNLIFANQFVGTIFAPDMVVTSYDNNVKGQVIAESFTKIGGQVHIHRYDGDVPPVNVPDTGSSLALLGGALATVALLRRRAA